MSDLIPSCSWSDFVKVVDKGRVTDLKSCEVLLPEHKLTAIIFHGDGFSVDYARTQADYLAMRTNAAGGKDPAELLSEIEEEICRSLNSNVSTGVADLKSRKDMKKSKKSAARRVKAKSKGSTRRLVGASAGV